MMPCDFEHFLDAYHDGELPEPHRREIAQHAEQCPACAKALRDIDELSQAFASMRSIPRPALSAESLTQLHEHVDAMTSDRSLLRFAEALSGIAAALLVAATLWMTQARSGATVDPEASWQAEAITLQQQPQSDESQPLPRNGTVETAEWIVAGLSSRRGAQ
jgi:anti-sigma factor RsiW